MNERLWATRPAAQGLSAEKLAAQQAVELPPREVLSLVPFLPLPTPGLPWLGAAAASAADPPTPPLPSRPSGGATHTAYAPLA